MIQLLILIIFISIISYESFRFPFYSIQDKSFSIFSISTKIEKKSNEFLTTNKIQSYDETKHIVDKSKDIIPIVSENSLNIFERLNRALSFYSTAVPVFLSYSALDAFIDIKKSIFNSNMTIEEQEALYNRLHVWGSDEITEKIKELKGFYVKTGQIISTRVDIFPEEYTTKLSIMQDALDPLPGYVIKDIVKKELLHGAELDEIFSWFDEEPLGSASIAQVHKAQLLDGRIVAVKVQRPGIEAKLLADIANLKTFSKLISSALPIDYYKVFCELERSLLSELDFLSEAQSAMKIAAAVTHSPLNKRLDISPVVVPLPLAGLVSKHVLVMEFIEGIPLSKMASEMQKRNITVGSIESKLFGRKLLSALTDAYGYMIFGSGIIHGDPHPGNLFVMPNGDIAMLDCGQVKEITRSQRLGIAEVVMFVNQWEQVNRKVNENKDDIIIQNELNSLTTILANKVKSFGVIFKEGVNDTCAAAVAILLFGNSDTKLPGGFAGEEISKDSPIVQVAEFPQELVLLGRATVMIRGIANRLGISWGLSDRWFEIAKESISSTEPKHVLPIWTVSSPQVYSSTEEFTIRKRNLYNSKDANSDRLRFRDVLKSFNNSLKLIFVRLSI